MPGLLAQWMKSALDNSSSPIANIQPGGKDRWRPWLRQLGEKERHATIDWCMPSMPSFIVAAGKASLLSVPCPPLSPGPTIVAPFAPHPYQRRYDIQPADVADEITKVSTLTKWLKKPTDGH